MNQLQLLRIPTAQSIASADNHKRYHFHENLTGNAGEAVYVPFDPDNPKPDTVILAAVESGEIYTTQFNLGAAPDAPDQLTAPLQFDSPGGQQFEFDPALDANARDISVSIGTKKYNGDLYQDAEPVPYANPYAPAWNTGGASTVYVRIHIHMNDGACVVIERELTDEVRAPASQNIEYDPLGGPLTISASGELPNPDIVLLNQPKHGYVITPLPAAGYGYPILVPQHSDVATVVADALVKNSQDSYQLLAFEAASQQASPLTTWLDWPPGVVTVATASGLFSSPAVVRLEGAGIIDVSS